MKSPKRVAIIGTGISGMAAAIELADKGMRVTAFEKNASYGGRGRQHLAQGYAFDLGPSWYWMPDIFEAFFNRYGKSTSDYFELVRLDPSYRIVHRQGVLDALAYWPNAVACLGKPTPDQLGLVASALRRPIVIALDKDARRESMKAAAELRRMTEFPVGMFDWQRNHRLGENFSDIGSMVRNPHLIRERAASSF